MEKNEKQKKTKRVGILTLYYKTYNFGAQLQAYALQKYIEKKGYICEIIRFKWCCEETIEGYQNAAIDYKGFADFSYSIKHSKRLYNSANINECIIDYDIFIVGSDQIWGVEKDMPLINLPIMCLEFVPDNKVKVAYAGSFGASNPPARYNEILKNEISNFDYLSVREKSASVFVEKVFGSKPAIVLDPVFLVETNEWKNLTESKDSNEESYILFYTAGANPQLEKILSMLKNRLGIHVIRVGYISGELMEPRKFVECVKNAKYVLTDSFHATAFSILFHKCFVVLPVDNEPVEKSKNARLIDLLHLFNLAERFISDISHIDTVVNDICNLYASDIDYESVEQILESQRIISNNYLENALECEKSAIIEKHNNSGERQMNGLQKYYMKSVSKYSSDDRMTYENVYWEQYVDNQKLLRNYYNEIKRNMLLDTINKYVKYGSNNDSRMICKDRLFIYGAGKVGRLLSQYRRDIIGFIDSNTNSSTCEGYPVYKPGSSELGKVVGDGDGSMVIITPTWDYEEILELLKEEYNQISVIGVDGFLKCYC